MSSVRNIQYGKKDFNSFREQLIEFAKNYFPDTYSDFSETSPGMMFMEMAAYVGDVLSFYQDVQVQETFIQYAKNPANLYAIAYMMGYRPKVTTVSEAQLQFTYLLGAIEDTETGNYEPDWSQACKILENSRFGCKSGATDFILRDTVDFGFSSSYDPTYVSIASLDDDGNPNLFYVNKYGKAYSGNVRTATFTFGEYQKFRTIYLNDSNIISVLSIREVEDPTHVWTEVPFLGQDTVFVEESLDAERADEDHVAYNLRLKKVDRRFVTRFDSKGRLMIQFGAGMYANDSDEENFLPNPNSLGPSIQDLDKYDIAYDPSNFLFSKSYGLAPVNCTLEVTYLVGGGIGSNVPAETITELKNVRALDRNNNAVTSFQYQDPVTGQSYPRLLITNPAPAVGGRNGDTPDEVRENSLRSFAEQKRIVTLQDFNVRALSMPQKFGAISKAYAVNEPLDMVDASVLSRNPLAITLYVLSQDNAGHLIAASDTVKDNLRTYLSQYMLITDAIDIKDAFVVGVGIRYDVVLRPDVQINEVLSNCTDALKEYMDIEKRQINEPINLSDMYLLLDRVEGVQTVKNIEVYNKGDVLYDIRTATRNSVVYPSYDPCIFEIKNPDTDIEGRVVSL